MTQEELNSNIMVFGYGQAALYTAFWVLYLLSLFPEIEKRVVGEIQNVLSKGPLVHERLNEFDYLSRVITETLRLFPGNYYYLCFVLF